MGPYSGNLQEMLPSEDDDPDEDEAADAKGPCFMAQWLEALPASAFSDADVDGTDTTTSDCRNGDLQGP